VDACVCCQSQAWFSGFLVILNVGDKKPPTHAFIIRKEEANHKVQIGVFAGEVGSASLFNKCTKRKMHEAEA